MYASPRETLEALENVGYFTDLNTATTVYLAGKIHRPVMLEGPAGAGKTELASSVARAYGVRQFLEEITAIEQVMLFPTCRGPSMATAGNWSSNRATRGWRDR